MSTKTLMKGRIMAVTTKSKVYHKFAEYYDRMGADSFSNEMVEYTNRVIERFRFEPREAL